MSNANSNNGINQIENIEQVKKAVGAGWKWTYWNDEIQKALQNSKEYLDEAEKTVKIYKAKHYSINDSQTTRDVKPVYNILYSNVETLKPLVFSRLPNPRVRRRNLEKSNVNKLLSILLERNVKRILEDTNAQIPIEQARNDFLIVKRGLCRVLFKQEIINTAKPEEFTEATDTIDEEVEPAITKEELGEKEIKLEYVNYKDILFSPAEKWEDVVWAAFRHNLTQAELKEKFGVYKGKKINLEEQANSEILNDNLEPEGLFKKAEVWEIWDKRTNKITFWTAGYNENILNEKDDDYKLKNFFNIPRPLGIDSGFDDVNQPIPDYKYYEDQAKELDRISNRILAILPYISMGGMYNAALTSTDADNFMKAIDNYFPVKMPLDGDILKMIYERDIAKLASVLQILYEERQQTIAAIQQISGISDIVRGQTDSKETATAQELKGNFAVSRIQPLQKEVEFFCRDIVRIIVEMLAENFNTTELAKMAQMKVFDMDALAKQFAAESQKEQIPPEQVGQYVAAKLKPYQNEIKSGQATSINLLTQANKILKDDKLRGWAIEVETDSTIKVDQNAERQSVIDFADAIAKVSNDFLPALQAGFVSKDAFKGILSYIMRRFDGSEEVEELLAGDDNEEANQADQMQQQITAKEMEQKDREIGVKEQDSQTKAFSAKAKADNDQGKLEVDAGQLHLDESKAILQADTAQDDIEARTAAVNKKIEESNLDKAND